MIITHAQNNSMCTLVYDTEVIKKQKMKMEIRFTLIHSSLSCSELKQNKIKLNAETINELHLVNKTML